MGLSQGSRLVSCYVWVLLSPLAGSVAAQSRPQPVGEISAGPVLFADDGVVTEPFVGGALRVYVSPRLGIGPELVAIRGDSHSHLMLTGNLTFDVLGPVKGRAREITPFLVAGGGLFTTRDRFTTGTYTSTEGAFTAGGGVRARVGDRLTIGADARVGWELHLRLNAVIGVRLGR
jgi:hypothetical protein